MKVIVKSRNMNCSIRWAFNIKEWKPNKAEWKLSVQCIQKHEGERCHRFVFSDDCKSSLVGQLLLRKAVSESLSLSYDKIIFDRTPAGKPYIQENLENPTLHYGDKISFNISHNGDFCVLASELDFKVGVDVMKIDYKDPLSKRFKFMKNQFSPHEQDFMSFPSSKREQLQRFFRLWCLKESYVKANGTGIAYNLQTLSFMCKTFNLKSEEIATDTVLFKDEIYEKEWKFEESLLQDGHCVAVALTPEKGENFKAADYSPNYFKIINFDYLMKNCVPFEEIDETLWENFMSKSDKNL